MRSYPVVYPGRLGYHSTLISGALSEEDIRRPTKAGFSVSVIPTNFIKSFPIRFRPAKGSRFLVIIFYFATLTLINNLLFPDISLESLVGVEVWPNPLPPFILQLRSTFDRCLIIKEILGSSSRSRTISLFLTNSSDRGLFFVRIVR